MPQHAINLTPGSADNAPVGGAKINADMAELFASQGTTGASAISAPTYAAARLLAGTATGDMLQVLGRTAQNDGGQGRFQWIQGGTTTIDDGYELAATGGIWQRVQTKIKASTFGLDPNGITASDVQLNLAIQCAIKAKKKLVVAAGFFLLSAPLAAYKTNAFSLVIIEGQGGNQQGGRIAAIGNAQLPNGPAFPNTTFYANYTDKPGIIVNAGRGVELRNFCIQGLNLINLGTGNAQNFYPPQSDPTAYVTNGCRDSRYSPYAGICIDPLTCTTPPDGGYPGLTYPSSLNSGSHCTLIENVWVGGFVVGVMSGPGTVNANGDQLTCRNVSVDSCRVAYSAGNSQAREFVITTGNINNCHTCFDTFTYGNILAPAPKISDMQLGGSYAILNLFAGAGSGSMVRCYAESVCTVGCWGHAGTPTAGPFVIEELQFQQLNNNFNNYPASTPPGGCPVQLLTSGPMFVSGSMFNFAFTIVEAWNFISSGPPITFENCNFTGAIEARRIPPIGVGRSLQGPTLINCYINGQATGGQSQHISDVLLRSGGNSITVYGNGIGRLNATYQTRVMPDTTTRTEYAYVAPGAGVWDSSSITLGGNFSAMTLNATTVTFTKTNASQFFCENDILCWGMKSFLGATLPTSIPALKIPVGGIVGNNVTANMLWDPSYYDTVANQPGAGTSVDLVVMQWAPTGKLTCTTNGTVNLTAVSPANTLIAGDFVIGSGPNGADIPNVLGGNACRVVSTDGAGNAVLSKTATGSHAGVGLRFGYLSPLTPVIVTVANLPPAIKGLRYMVSDASAPVFGSAVVGGGAVQVPVYADSTPNWIVG